MMPKRCCILDLGNLTLLYAMSLVCLGTRTKFRRRKPIVLRCPKYTDTNLPIGLPSCCSCHLAKSENMFLYRTQSSAKRRTDDLIINGIKKRTYDSSGTCRQDRVDLDQLEFARPLTIIYSRVLQQKHVSGRLQHHSPVINIALSPE